MIPFLLIMLGKGESEYPKIRRLFNDDTSWRIINKCFHKVYISLPYELQKECTDQYIYDNITHSTAKTLKVGTLGISGGSHIGKNRKESLEKLKIELAKEYKNLDNDQIYVMMLDPDDLLINYQLWEHVFHNLNQMTRPPKLVEFNYVTSDITKVQFNHDEYGISRYLEKDPWDMRIYDKIEGYKYYNPCIRVSGIQKLFSLSELKLSEFDSWERYEDGLVFAELLSRIERIIVVPFASIVYNRDDSEVLTKDSLDDEWLMQLQDHLKSIKITNIPGCVIPYIALNNQVNRWIELKK